MKYYDNIPFSIDAFPLAMHIPLVDLYSSVLYLLQFQFAYEVLYILCFLFVALALSFLMVGLSYILAEQKPDLEKNSGYECGFDPFSDARDPFHIRFYLLSILFIIFDIEIVFFFPWAISLYKTAILGFYTMSFFVFILTIGFIYEWKKNALEWD
jgi:NADH-quinone oxidoreductase subunit A